MSVGTFVDGCGVAAVNPQGAGICGILLVHKAP